MAKVFTDFSKKTEIKIGDTVSVFGAHVAKVIKIHPFGTMDVQTKGGKTLRVSGLAF